MATVQYYTTVVGDGGNNRKNSKILTVNCALICYEFVCWSPASHIQCWISQIAFVRIVLLSSCANRDAMILCLFGSVMNGSPDVWLLLHHTCRRRMNTNLFSLVVAAVTFFLALRWPFGCIIHRCYFSFFNFFVIAPMHLQTVSQRKRVSEIEMKWMAEDKPTATAKHDWRMPCRRWGEWLQWKFLMYFSEFFGLFQNKAVHCELH